VSFHVGKIFNQGQKVAVIVSSLNLPDKWDKRAQPSKLIHGNLVVIDP